MLPNARLLICRIVRWINPLRKESYYHFILFFNSWGWFGREVDDAHSRVKWILILYTWENKNINMQKKKKDYHEQTCLS